MSITLTRTWTRPNTSAEFFPVSSTNPVRSQMITRNTLFQSNVATTTAESADQNTLTITQTFNSITDVGNLLSHAPDSLAMYVASYAYCSSTGQRGITVLSGISNAFNITSTYTFASGTDVSSLVSVLTNFTQNSSIVGNVVQTPTSLTMVHQYKNSDDWNTWNWKEFNIVPSFANITMTKTESWTFV